jgi:DegV family protein with EDD domain
MPEARVAIVTDSTACVPPTLVSQYRIGVVPLNLIFAGRTFVDGLTEDANEFYRLLRTSRSPPTTAAPSPGTYLQHILEAGERAPSVLCLTISTHFSAMYDSAFQAVALAREERPDLDVRVLDSHNAAMAQGFIAIEAARAAAEGLDMERVIARAEAVMPRVGILAMLDTLTYVARSGRVPRVVAWATSPLQVKPIVEFRQHEVHRLSLTRTRRRAVDRLLRLMEERAGRGGPVHLCVQHSNVPEEALALASRVQELVRPVEMYVAELTQVMGVHTGPGFLGFAYYLEG